MNRPLIIFISSAISEFLAERKALKAALERWPFVHAWVFEEETAYAEHLKPGYLRRAAEADIFVVLIGEQPSGPVEEEFETALNAGRPILAFVRRSKKAKAWARALFEKYQASDRFKYAVLDAQDLKKVIEAVSETIVYRFRLTSRQALQLVTAHPQPRLSPSERQELDCAYLAEVVQKYEFWRTHYTPLAAIAPLRPEPVSAVAPHEFLPRGFEVLLREKLRPEERERREEPKTEHYDDLRDAIEKHGDLILLGDPGAGKTTTLWRLMLDYAQRVQANPRSPLPLFIELGHYDGRSDILDFLRTELVLASKGDAAGKVYPAHRRLAAHLDEYLDDGRLILLFDALNEMPQSGYADSIRRLEAFRDAHRDNRFIFTCRALDYTVKLDLPEATIQDLDEGAQHDFLAVRFPDVGERLFETLHQSHRDLLEIGRNPYMLFMIGCVYWDSEGELPPNRSLLFQSFVNALLERERKTHPDRWLDAEVQRLVLSDLALAIQYEHGRGTSVPHEWAEQHLTGRVHLDGREATYNPADLLYLGRSASLLDESADGSLRFTHQLLQEYFAAVALLRLGMDNPLLREATRYYTWDEVLVLLAGLMEDATPLVELLMPIDPYLAARCMSAVQAVSPAVREALVARLSERLKGRFRAERVAAVWALSDFKTEVAIPHLVPLLKDKDWQMRRVSTLALSVLKAEAAIPYLIPLLQDEQPDVRGMAAEALGALKAEMAISNLVLLLEDKNPYPCKAAAWALGALKAETAIPNLVLLLEEVENRNVRKAAMQTLGTLNAEAVIPHLVPLLKDHRWHLHVHDEAVMEVLGAFNAEEVIPHLVPLLKDEDRHVRLTAAQVMGKLKSEAVIPHLVPLLKDEKDEFWSVHKAATQALSEFKAEVVIPHLAPLLKDEEYLVRLRAVDTLSALKTDEAAIPHLISLLTYEHRDVRETATRVLGTLSAEAFLPHLIPLLKDKDVWVRCVTAMALGELKAEAAVPHLLPLLKDKDRYVRRAVALALGTLKAEAAIPHLATLLKDKRGFVRWAAVKALGELKSEAAIPHLLPLLKDEDESVRRVAVWALGALKPEAVIPHLVPRLKDKDWRVREAGAWTLGILKAEAAIPYLVPLLKDKDPDVRETAARALGELRGETAVPHLFLLLSDEVWKVSRAAVRVLDELKVEAAIPYLVPLLKDEDWRVREAGAEVLGTLKAKAAIPYLVPLLKDENWNVRWKAKKALGNLKKVATAIPHLVSLLNDED